MNKIGHIGSDSGLISIREQTRVVLKMRGLDNLGNTCFFNTAIQCLAHVPPLSKHLFFNEVEKDCAITKEYQKLVKKLFLKDVTEPADPTELLTAFRHRFPSFTKNRQHDAQEVILHLIDVFEESLGKEFVTGIFNGEDTQETIYSGGISTTKTPFAMMILDVNAPGRLEDLINLRQKYTGIQDYTDQTGKKHHVAAVRTMVTRWPMTIIFSFSMYSQKFPIEIPYEFQGRKLFALVVHKGASYYGHYNLIVKRHGKWYIKDDESVQEFETPEIMKGPFYMALYRL